MKNRPLAVFVTTMVSFSIVFTSNAVAPPPSSATVAKTILELWKLRKFSEIERFVNALSTKNPKRISTNMALVFVEFMIRGDLEKAQTRLSAVNTGIKSANINTSERFAESLQLEIHGFEMIAGFMQSEGKTNADVKREHSVAETRQEYGSKIPELLELLSVAPDADLP